MRAILPGRPQSTRQALCTAHWDGLRIVAYISGNAAIILSGPQTILQTIYVDTVETISAITLDETTGRIALCDPDNVYIYRPVGREEGVLRWVQVQELRNPNALKVTSLSWGGSTEELLLGGSRLVLWYIPDSGNPIVTWDQKLAYPTVLAYLSPDSGLIASVGQHDRLVKLWRRLSYETDGTRFDVSYLPHPSTVTNLHWRKPWHEEQSLDNLLYTFCSDDNIRVWTAFDPHALSVLQEVATINMNASIQPRRLSVGSMSRRRFAFILDSRDFASATEKAVQGSNAKSADHALEHLIEIANRSPEICIVLDGLGHMSVWGLENAGYKNRILPAVFHISHVDGMDIRVPLLSDPLDDYVQFCVFAGGSQPSSLSILLHSYAGDIDWYDSQITHLFDTAIRKSRAHLISSLAGHSDPIQRIVRNVRGTIVLSATDEGHVSLWQQKDTHSSAPLLRRSTFAANEDIKDAVVLSRGRYAVILHSHGLELWDVREAKAERLGRLELHGQIPERITQSRVVSERALTSRVIIGYYPDRTTEAWEFLLPALDDSRPSSANRFPEMIRSLGEVKLHVHNRYNSLVSVCDNMSSSAQPAKPQETSALGFTAALAKDGIVEMVRSFEEPDSTKPRLSTGALLETSIQRPRAMSASGTGKVILVNEDSNSLSIWDAKTGVWEYEHELDGTDTVKTFAWALSPQGHPLVAICFDYHIVVLGQVRYAYPGLEPAWVDLRHIRIRDVTTQSIADLCWLRSGDLVVGSGVQFFIFEGYARTHHNRDARSLHEVHSKLKNNATSAVMAMLNSLLPIFHPTYLSLLALLGYFRQTKDIIHRLHRDLKFFSEGDDLPSFLDLQLDTIGLANEAGSKTSFHNGTNGLTNGETEQGTIGDIAEGLVKNVKRNDIWQLSDADKAKLSAEIQVFVELEKHEQSIDTNGLRYLHAFYTSGDDSVAWSAIAFASLSTSQEILIDLVTRFHGGKLTWEAARKSGMFCWLSDPESLRLQMENIGRTEYTRNEDRNPVDCSLYYLALGKKNVLQGLWRMAVGVREKENTLKLLMNNFNEPRWKSSALKNAYALLSKRRFHYAAAFFLLGGSLWDAVNVCVHQLKDLQLAIALARVFSNDGDLQQSSASSSAVLSRLINETVLPLALESVQGRWLASWAYNSLGLPSLAIQSLAYPLHNVIGKPLCDIVEEVDSDSRGSSPQMVNSLSYASNDPLLTTLYTQLRTQLVKKNQWRYGGGVSAKDEWAFVMRCVRLYRHMGCDALALTLVQTWEFIPLESANPLGHRRSVGEATIPALQIGIQRRKTFIDLEREADEAEAQQCEALSGLSRELQSTTIDEGDVKIPNKNKMERAKPPPTQFEEPSADSLLDSFGF
ncbi:uncharacterized protein A1O9_02383 [Exophiala aquamarina CBS 119918]|uniref:RAVE complex protein Rav1 C-terminal domain-containing protein n=1 Tax=Exophiala aquamarina CBS 119918 TaxID=1182545 RepID=A0A072PLU0_9EURO|nr:uncharacterized protein A1O9_02383 [Exophiala aquamarina CBS 119918]KEF60821.1 hypothetical protein A1O9_02383 [Exophiala aquamarina CBS 119918]